MVVDFEPGVNELTFRIGDDEATAKTIRVVYDAPATPIPEVEPPPLIGSGTITFGTAYRRGHARDHQGHVALQADAQGDRLERSS